MPPRPLPDLAKATFGEPWVSGDRRSGYVAAVMATLPTGRRTRVTRRGSTSQAALNALATAMTGAPARRTITLGELAASWEAAQRTSNAVVGESTRLLYMSHWHLHLEPTFGGREASNISHDELFDFLHVERTIRPKSLVDTLRAFYRHGMNRGLVSQNPTAGGFEIASPKVETHPIDAATQLRIERHLANLPARGRRTDPLLLHDVWLTMRGSVARIGEVLGLKVSAWDSATRQLQLGLWHIGKVESPNGGAKQGPISGAKTAAGRRTIVVADDIAEVLNRRTEGQPADAWVFRGDTGAYISPDNARSRLRREFEKLGIKGEVTPHDLRDSGAQMLAQQLTNRLGVQAGLQAAASHLGHAQISRVLRSYVDTSRVVDDQSAVLAMTNPLHEVAERARNQLEAVRNEAQIAIGSVKIARGVVRIVVNSDAVEVARAELVELGDLVEVVGDDALVWELIF